MYRKKPSWAQLGSALQRESLESESEDTIYRGAVASDSHYASKPPEPETIHVSADFNHDARYQRGALSTAADKPLLGPNAGRGYEIVVVEAPEREEIEQVAHTPSAETTSESDIWLYNNDLPIFGSFDGYNTAQAPEERLAYRFCKSQAEALGAIEPWIQTNTNSLSSFTICITDYSCLQRTWKCIPRARDICPNISGAGRL